MWTGSNIAGIKILHLDDLYSITVAYRNVL